MKPVSYFPSACGRLVLTMNQTYYIKKTQAVCIRNSRLVTEVDIGVSPAGAARDPAVVGCMAQLSLALFTSQPMWQLPAAEYSLSAVWVVQTWPDICNNTTHCSRSQVYAFLFPSTSSSSSNAFPCIYQSSLLFSSLLFLAHHLSTHHNTSPYPPAASHLVLPLFLYRSLFNNATCHVVAASTCSSNLNPAYSSFLFTLQPAQ